MRWLILLAFLVFALIFVRGVYRELVKDPLMAWLHRRNRNDGR